MKKHILVLSMLLGAMTASAQDPQFSQFYAAPMYHNPAFTGSGYAPRVIFNFRNQWPSLSANFTSSAISVDHYIEKFNSGVGLMVLNDQQGSARLKNTEISGFYSYQVNLIDDHFLRLGVQATRSNRGFNTNGLTFPDQFDNNGYNGNPTSDPLANISSNASFTDFSTGFLYYNPKAYLGFSVHHLTQPDLGLTTGSAEVLDRKYMVNGGFNIPLGTPPGGAGSSDKEFIASPAFLYKQQGKFSQLDLGAYVTYSPLTVGLWYRGIPLKKNGTESINHDALVALAGFRFDNFSFGYSYDLTISSLGTTSGGAHEISVAYQFDAFESEKNPHIRRRKKELSCPKF
ncbi:MAG: type IX secretion system membrane protein PorP/SprF [Cytophagales bacterium]|nr:type IX secretion system membrane protein PorP/SprF [Cytophagales bacterium]